MTKKPQNITNITKISLTDKMIKMLDYLKATGEEFNAKTLALRLSENLNTTRTYLNQLAKANLVKCQKLGGMNFYSFPIKIPELKRELPELKIHGLTLKFTHQGKHWVRLPGWWRQPIYVKVPQSGEISSKPYQVSTGQQYRKRGVVKFRQGKQTIMVYFDGSEWPLNWEEFLGLLKWVGKVTRCDLFTDKRWEVRQFGAGTDFEKTVLEGFKGSISIHDFLGHVARIYNKELADGTEVIRTELHGQLDMVVGSFLEAARGGMLFGDVMNIMGRQTASQEETVGLLRHVSKQLTRVATGLGHVYEFMRELKKEKAKRKNGL